jgi:hypothetical protein
MNRQRTILQEYTKDPKAIIEARSAPIPEPEIDRSLAFLRAIVLDLPIQTGGMVEVPQTIEEDHMKEMKKLAGLK